MIFDHRMPPGSKTFLLHVRGSIRNHPLHEGNLGSFAQDPSYVKGKMQQSQCNTINIAERVQTSGRFYDGV